jgi:hypothetical protein
MYNRWSKQAAVKPLNVASFVMGTGKIQKQ